MGGGCLSLIHYVEAEADQSALQGGRNNLYMIKVLCFHQESRYSWMSDTITSKESSVEDWEREETES